MQNGDQIEFTPDCNILPFFKGFKKIKSLRPSCQKLEFARIKKWSWPKKGEAKTFTIAAQAQKFCISVN